MEEGGANEARAFMLLELPALLEGLPSPHDPLPPVERARFVIDEMHRRRATARPEPAVLRDPFGAPRQVFAEMGRVIDAMTALLATSLFANEG